MLRLDLRSVDTRTGSKWPKVHFRRTRATLRTPRGYSRSRPTPDFWFTLGLIDYMSIRHSSFFSRVWWFALKSLTQKGLELPLNIEQGRRVFYL